MNSEVIWWIAVLRWLKVPISIYNLNILIKHSRNAVRSHFSKMAMPKMEIDIIMVVTYFMNVKRNEYMRDPFEFVHKQRKCLMLNVETYAKWENEEEIIRFSTECLRFALQLVPNYMQRSSMEKFNQQISIYMDKNRTS